MTTALSSITLTTAFKEAMASWPSGVAVVTAACEGEYYATTVATFSSLSLDPLMVLFSLTRGSRLLELLEHCGDYSISILAEGQDEVSNAFASSKRVASADLEGYAIEAGDGQLPAIDGSVAVLHCRLRELVPAGDHVIVIGDVDDVRAEAAVQPLVFFRRGYRRIKELS
jgi:flavin reductase (DIM6/NTAB) family NADH-FMN oxidoreductase RutF